MKTVISSVSTLHSTISAHFFSKIKFSACFKKKGVNKVVLSMLLFNSLYASASEEKIVSIGADVTEIIYALGKGNNVVARDSTSMQPEEVRSLPDIGYMRLLNTEGILANNPTLVLSSADAGPSTVFDQIAALNIPVHKIAAEKSLEGTLTKIATISEVLDAKEASQTLMSEYQKSIDMIDKTPLDLNVLFLLTFDGHQPSAAGKLTAPDVLFSVIGVNNAAKDIQKYQPITAESLAIMQPDVILVSQEGMKQLTEEKIWQLPGMDKTPAFLNKRIIVVDDASFLGFTLETPKTLNNLKKALIAFN